MTKKIIPKFFTFLLFAVGLGLIGTSISGLIRRCDTEMKYRERVDPLVEKYILGYQDGGIYEISSNLVMPEHERFNLLFDLDRLRFDMDWQFALQSLKYQLYVGIGLVLCGGLLIEKGKRKIVNSARRPQI